MRQIYIIYFFCVIVYKYNENGHKIYIYIVILIHANHHILCLKLIINLIKLEATKFVIFVWEKKNIYLFLSTIIYKTCCILKNFVAGQILIYFEREREFIYFFCCLWLLKIIKGINFFSSKKKRWVFFFF